MNKIIRKGCHACLHGFRFQKRYITFDFCVDDSWYYEPVNQGVNKILGLSNGLLHMKHSIRLGGMGEDGEIILYAYAHTGKTDEHVAKKICRVTKGWHSCGIWIHKAFYQVQVDDTCITIPDKFYSRIHYLLYPFFGGRDKAPHNIKIQIKKLQNEKGNYLKIF